MTRETKSNAFGEIHRHLSVTVERADVRVECFRMVFASEQTGRYGHTEEYDDVCLDKAWGEVTRMIGEWIRSEYENAMEKDAMEKDAMERKAGLK